MERRIVAFLFITAVAMMINMWVVDLISNPDDQVAQEAQLDDADQPAPAADDVAAPAVDPEADAPAADTPAADDTAETEEVAPEAAPAQPAQPLRFATLGSVDPADGYRMLGTFTSRGAAVERVEMSSSRYRDLEVRGGYLGHLAPGTVTDGSGALVRVVGTGTPAAAAGLQEGDIITALDGTEILGPTALYLALSETRPRTTVNLTVRRGEETLTLPVTLTRQPLGVIQPEQMPGNPPDRASFLMDLAAAGQMEPNDPRLQDLANRLRDDNWELEQQENQVQFRYVLPELGLELFKRYRLELLAETDLATNSSGYTFGLEVEIRRIAGGPEGPLPVAYRLDGPNGLPNEGWWYAMKVSQRMFGSAGLRDVVVGFNTGRYTRAQMMSNAEIISAYEDGELATIRWFEPMAYVGVDAQYFASVLLPGDTAGEHDWVAESSPLLVGPIPEKSRHRNLTNVSCQVVSKTHVLDAPGDAVVQSWSVFAGPKEPEILAHYGLPDLIYYGWFGWVSKPLLSILHFFHDYVTFGNYGLAIILLTVMVRMCMFPLSRKQAMNMIRMQELQPEMKRIQEKYKNAPEQRMKAQQELFRKANYNPFTGCLPMLIQLPIFLGLYRGLAVDVQLRQAPLISESIGWASNLAAPDKLFNWSGFMPGIVVDLLGPYLNILPIVTVVLFLMQQKMFMPPPTDETQAAQQKVMKLVMVFMGLFFFRVPSGLCVYFITSSLWGIAERKLLPKSPALVSGEGGSGGSPDTPGDGNGGDNSPRAITSSTGTSSNGSSAASRQRRKKQKRR